MKILYVSNTKASWVQNDFKLLAKHFDVTDHYIDSPKSSFKSMNPFMVSQFDVIICWFASLSFFPLLLVAWILRKKIVIIAGGFDVVKLPSIQYGAFLDSWPKQFARKFIFNAAQKVISVSDSNQQEAVENAHVNTSKSVMIYHGFEKNQIPLKTFSERNKQIVTIGAINNETYLRKGHKYFIDLARMMPDWNFVLIGKICPDFLHIRDFKNCSNLTLLGYLPDSKLNEILNDSQFYLQLSQHEGFGCSVVEAALMGCYPIVFDRYALPEVVENCGKVIPFGDFSSLTNAIHKLANTNIQVEAVRLHYESRFPSDTREEKLVNLISSIS